MRALICSVVILVATSLAAQSNQLVVDAANTPATATTKVVNQSTTAKSADSIGDAVKALEVAKAANAELLRKQEAELQLLDELQKEADQIRVFSKRG